ncbi:hypothetical protein GCM10011386_13200 [Parapedobacter defluvii]|uniref:Acyl carrier protein phosphodiesterase n=1 Tax=Parapedobacter defluvii TaxID=2045106 RepID=A0ABQ1LFZ6_9SPHI|nr:hypothetical protein [Parapedobacter defluvii]RQP19383.1 MAG: hypothetical protein EAS52_02440 [Parapedobacter sp.]GGC22683.1 hypothetical protein GCM10011386_13200 [Parapedobacter defluvii]
MNFLSHYYFERYSHDPELVLGSILPDLIKNADRNMNVLPQKYEDRFGNNPKLQSIYQGWMRHVEVDRCFHSSAFFYDHTHGLRILLAPIVETTVIRPSFLSHITLELLLDHLLLHHKWVHESDFYEYLAAADREVTDRFLKLCGVQDTAFFFTYFNSFMRAQYVASYRDFGQITHAMVGICRRLWDVRLDEHQYSQITAVISAYTAELDGKFPLIFEEVQSKLS